MRKAGTAEDILVQSRCDASPIIMAPTSTSTGEVVKGGRAYQGGRGGGRQGGEGLYSASVVYAQGNSLIKRGRAIAGNICNMGLRGKSGATLTWMSGEMNKEPKKHRPTVTATRPVRPPSLIPT